ncbi:hypothetical protein ASZ90_015807 [hydrocarbon metagenome]|uniref:Uncharacterized protein n=1 Tax=hydrocarbon metagenome TaxID=938273 RepID=A0A0W8F0W2_9ZZZZ
MRPSPERRGCIRNYFVPPRSQHRNAVRAILFSGKKEGRNVPG